ncbi:hypothetical protein DERF_005086 [Dermatophagoides farinae]|uniref:Uncharacterized protein n=1 Tax=Dermatophagoides farinae TaxID=6954 RepID=A0A922LAU8_DERFA|nr:hypothetical protein DERF_005086 [Dermatophagoides farinae]
MSQQSRHQFIFGVIFFVGSVPATQQRTLFRYTIFVWTALLWNAIVMIYRNLVEGNNFDDKNIICRQGSSKLYLSVGIQYRQQQQTIRIMCTLDTSTKSYYLTITKLLFQ